MYIVSYIVSYIVIDILLAIQMPAIVHIDVRFDPPVEITQRSPVQ